MLHFPAWIVPDPRLITEKTIDDKEADDTGDMSAIADLRVSRSSCASPCLALKRP